MGTTLIDTARDTITPEMTEKAAAETGESPENVRKAMNGAVPTIFAGLARHVSSPGGSSWIFEMLKGGGGEGGRGEGDVAERGQGLLSNIFGDRTSQVSNALASSSGIKSSSALRILSFAGPLVTGILGKEVMSRGLNAGGLTQLIASHRNAVIEDPATPPGLSEAMGIGNPAEVTGGVGRDVSEFGGEKVRDVREVGRDVRDVGEGEGERAAFKRPRLGPILAVLAAGALAVWGIFAFARGHAPRPGVTEMQPKTPTMPAPAPAASTAAPTEQPQTGENQGQPGENTGDMSQAPGGKTAAMAPAGSPEADLERAVKDESVPLPYATKVDALTFDSGSTTLGPEATASLGTVATILEANPSARVRVEGFADSIGDPTVNQALSRSRATAVKDALEAQGVPSDRVEVSGQGVSETAGNDTEQGRAVNRRVEIVVVSR